MTPAREIDEALLRGVSLLDPDAAKEIEGFLASTVSDNGLFRGRSAAGDLYYTVFGLSLLHAFGREAPAPLPATLARFSEDGSLDLVHTACVARCRTLMGNSQAAREIAGKLVRGAFRGRRKLAEVGLYDAFLGVLALDMESLPFTYRRGIARLLKRCRREGGGYARLPGDDVSTTPSTAAAMLLRHWLRFKPDDEAREWLQRQRSDGGFSLNAAAPQPDLLSTGVALFALRCSGVLYTPEEASQTVQFLFSAWAPEGGFGAVSAVGEADVEYTYYALLALGCC